LNWQVKKMLTFKSLKQFSIESNQPPSMDANIHGLDTFNQSKNRDSQTVD